VRPKIWHSGDLGLQLAQLTPAIRPCPLIPLELGPDRAPDRLGHRAASPLGQALSQRLDLLVANIEPHFGAPPSVYATYPVAYTVDRWRGKLYPSCSFGSQAGPARRRRLDSGLRAIT